MTKIIATLPALALMLAISGSAAADNGTVSASALAEMGLAGLEVMSDDAALAIRGKGYRPMEPPKMPEGEKPWSLAFGISYASVNGHGGNNDGAVERRGGYGGASAGTLDGFLAEGKYMASGEHFSEAGKTVTKSHELQVKGRPATLEIHTKSIRVYAGGWATASSL